MQISDLYVRWSSMTLLILMLNMTIPCATAQMPQTTQVSPTVPTLDYDPLLDEEPSSAATDAEVGGVGCLVANVAVGGSLIYLMGGFNTAFASMGTPLPPAAVLEGSAAIAFVLSSVCYIGVVLAPLAVNTYNNISERLELAQEPTRPLFAPGELWSIVKGNSSVPQQSTALRP